MFSCEFWEIFKNTYFEEHLRTTAPEEAFMDFFSDTILDLFQSGKEWLESVLPIINTVAHKWSVKNLFWKILQNSQENT